MSKTKYTYVYNGKVVRNSNNLYKYALVNHLNNVVSCSSTEEGAQKAITFPLKVAKNNLEYCKKKKPEAVAIYEQELENFKKWHVVKLEIIEN